MFTINNEEWDREPALEFPSCPVKPPTLDELLQPRVSLGEGEIMMYIRDPATGEYKPHIIAKAIPAPAEPLPQEQGTQQVNANQGGVVNLNPAHYDDDGDGRILLYLKVFIPFFFSFMIISLCCYKIVFDEQSAPELRAVFWSTLTGTAASWLPSAAAIRRSPSSKQ